MNRMIRAAAAVALLTSGLGSIGCVHTGTGGGRDSFDPHPRCRNVLDPCYPERYQFAARQAVIGPFAQQVHNGYVLNQTLWNYYFETGTDKLTPAGIEKLDSLVRSQPVDAKLYIQTARDLPPSIDSAKIPDARADLDVKRAAAILKYLGVQPAFAGPVPFEVYVHDAKVPGVIAEMPAGAFRGSFQGYRGGITGAAGIGALGTGGSTNLTVAPVINNAPGPR